MEDSGARATALKAAKLCSEVDRLRKANESTAEALRSVEALAWLDVDPTNDTMEICQALAGRVRDAGDLCQIGVYLLNPAKMDFDLILSIPGPEEAKLHWEFERQLNAGMIGWALRERRLVVAPAPDPDHPEDAERSVIILPVSTSRQVWGLVICFPAYGHAEIPQNMLRLMMIVANHFGMAIENATLMRRLSEQNQGLEDIVRQRAAELVAKNNALKEALEELQRLDAAKDDFISLVAHELRTPLTSILSFSEFLVEENTTARESKEFSKFIHDEATRLNRLVTDVLDLAKMDAGKLSYQYADEDLNQMIEFCASSLATVAVPLGIKIHFDKDASVPAMQLDHDRIQQVLLGMLNNAVQFSEDGGEIIVTTRNEADAVRVSVQDFGVGIASRDIPKVFDKFEQVEDIKHHSKGTGFGMPIAKNIIEVGHKGRMWVESEGRGKGATFFFTLKKKDQSPAGLYGPLLAITTRPDLSEKHAGHTPQAAIPESSHGIGPNPLG